MKRILCLLLLISYVFSFLISFHETDNKEIEEIEDLENKIGQKFIIPNDVILANPKEFYPVLSDVANKCKVNIFRPTISFKDNSIEISKYILLNGKTSFFDYVSIKQGKALNVNETQDKAYFLSTRDTHEKNQIGIIDDFGNNDTVTINSLKQSYNYLPVNGVYFAEMTSGQSFDVFLQTLIKKLNEHFNGSYTTKDFVNQSVTDTETFTKYSTDYLKYINYIVFVIILFFLIYYIFNDAKRIGIMKLHGTSNWRIWYLVIGKLILYTFVFSTILSLLISFLLVGIKTPFVYNILVQEIITLIIIILLSLISYIYISRIKINQTIRNRKDTKGIFVLNYLFKMGCVIALIFMSNYILEQYSQISQKDETLKDWKYSKEYGMFYPYETGYDSDEVKNSLPRTTKAINKELYPILNHRGSLFINSRSYEEQTLIQGKNFKGIRSITVNPNYLKKFPVMGVDNKPVNISENEVNWIVLVPEKYQNKRQQILDYFKEQRQQDIEYQKNFLKEEAPDYIRNQDIKIVWLSNNQKIFSFNPEVFKKENNMIIDPIIQVLTEKNSLISDREGILGNGGTDPLKVKLINNNSAYTYKILYPELKKLKLDDNFKYLVNINQLFLEEIYKIHKVINNLLFTGFVIVLGFLIVLTQSLIVFFNKYEQKYTIYRLFGISFFRTYRNYFSIFLLTWLFQLIISTVINKNLDLKLLLIIAVIMIFELIASVITISILERKNKVRVLKGG